MVTLLGIASSNSGLQLILHAHIRSDGNLWKKIFLHGRMRTASEWLNLFTGSVVIRIFVVVQITKLVKDGSYLLHQKH